MQVKQIEALDIVGQPFSGQVMDAKTSFAAQIMDLEQKQDFEQLLRQAKGRRAMMIEFGPDNFMLWYGVINSQNRKHYFKFSLPAAQVAWRRKKANLEQLLLPLNQQIPDFLKELEKNKIKSYENLGDSPVPYFLQLLDAENQILDQYLYLASE